jgi:FlaA1/EpsC-like NDP-sugar epimerase
VLIGTLESLTALAGQLAVTNLLPQHVGCIVVGAEAGLDVAIDVAGLPVIGRVEQLADMHAIHAFSVGVVSLPAGERALSMRVREALRSLGIPERFVPTLPDLLSRPPQASATASTQPQLNMAELIGRTPYGIDRRLVRAALEAKRVLITGAGGSIGSDICRIVATFKPSLLIMMERSENALFDIDRQIARRFPDLPRKALLNDVADADATLRHVVQLKPHAVFHAAAHKHVPLMEDHPALAISNNVLGTKSIADASIAVGAERFVMISTDKAVNPSSTMGATKRIAEMYVQWLGSLRQGADTPRQRPRTLDALASYTPSHTTQCSIVRFGNVLGSACSVLPIWGQQLSEGGPLTVTDPRMTRFFMTIPEAASLVIQAGSISQQGPAGFMLGGDEAPAPALPTIYVLDMGDPVRILDLAMRFATLHGYQPRLVTRDGQPFPGAPIIESSSGPTSDQPTIDIAITGVRPGEKLHEELVYAAEALAPTDYPGVLALGQRDESGGQPLDIPAMIADLAGLQRTHDPALVRAALRRYLPEYAESAGAGKTNPGTFQDTNVSGRPPGVTQNAA